MPPIPLASPAGRVRAAVSLGLVAVLLLHGCASAARSTAARSSAAPPHPVTAEAISYFLDIAYGSEYGEPGDRLRVWDREVRVRVQGAPTPADSAEVDRVIADINRVVGRRLMSRTVASGNLDVLFVGQDGFDRYARPVARRNRGYVYISWNRSSHIQRGIVLVRRDLPLEQRRHAVREELTQALGLLNDSWRHPESIFFQGPSTVTAFSPLDEQVIWLHDQHRARAGARRASMLQWLTSTYLRR